MERHPITNAVPRQSQQPQRPFWRRPHHRFLATKMVMLFLILKLLSLIQISQTATSQPSSSATIEEILQDAITGETTTKFTTTLGGGSSADGKDEGGGILDSIWNTFKQTLETARASNSYRMQDKSGRSRNSLHSSSARTSTTPSEATSATTTTDQGVILSAKRIQLLELTIEEHYTRQLVQSSPHLDENFLVVADAEHGDPNNNDGNEIMDVPPYIEARPIRWMTPSSSDKNKDDINYCFGFASSSNSYWSFQWCPNEEVSQGIRQIRSRNNQNIDKSSTSSNKDDPSSSSASSSTTRTISITKDDREAVFVELDVHYSLGHFIAPDAEQQQIKREDEQFFRAVYNKYPDIINIQPFTEGSICSDDDAVKGTNRITNNRLRRTSIVLIHKQDSVVCENETEYSSSPHDDHVITKVEEPTRCKYIIHVCKVISSTRSQPEMQTSCDGGEQTEVAEESEVERHQEDYERFTTESLSSTTTTTPKITEADAQELKKAMQNMHEIMYAYLHQTEATTSAKANPDRTTALHVGLPPIPMSKVQENLQLIRDMFTHAYDSYMYNAYPASEIKPLTCKGSYFNLVKVPALTLIDSLDTLMILGNYTEFARSVERLRYLDKYLAKKNDFLHQRGLFALNQNVSVFETNIRVLGGLLSAHQLALAFTDRKVFQSDVLNEDGTVPMGRVPSEGNDDDIDGVCKNENKHDLESCSASSTLYDCSSSLDGGASSGPCHNETIEYWEYDGYLLELAQDIGDRLVPAFKTPTGIPYGTVNLLSGVPQDETTIASLAGGGTLTLEMELLSRLTGNPEYGRLARLATRALWMRRSQSNLFGKHIDTKDGAWRESLSGIGSNSDSFYEYLVKHYLLFPDDHDFWYQTLSAYGGIHNESRMGEWYVDVDVNRGVSSGGGSRKVFEALMAFYPGMQVLLGELTPAARTLNSFFLAREHVGFLPERFNYGHWRVDGGGGKHLLRPELLESAYFLHRATKGFLQSARNKNGNIVREESSGWQWAADFALHRLEKVTRTECGYASVDDVSPSVTGEARYVTNNKKLKLFDEMPSYFLSETLKYLYLTFDEQNILHTDKDRDWIFTTEAHPIHTVPGDLQITTDDSLKAKKSELINRLKWRIVRSAKVPEASDSKLEYETWTRDTKFDSFASDIKAVKKQVESSQRLHNSIDEQQQHDYGIRTRKDSGLLEAFLVEGQVHSGLDFYNETQNSFNSAHLSWNKMGNKHLPPRSCENFHSPDMLWIRALNGGLSDYSDAYVSSATDYAQVGDNQFYILGSIDALAMHGSRVHPAELKDVTKLSPIRDTTPRKTVAKKEEPAKKDGMDRFDMGGELGQFDVSAFAGGSGFFIQRVATSESFITTLISDGADVDESDAYVMVYGRTPVENPNGEEESEGTSDDPVDPSKDGGILGFGATGQFERSVIMSNFKGDNFACKIEILVQVPADGSAEVLDEGGETKKIVATYPCAPALFGPTHISHLVTTNGLLSEARLQGPVPGDEYGCKGGGDRTYPPGLEFMPMQIQQEDEKAHSVPRGTTQDSSAEEPSSEDPSASVAEDLGADSDEENDVTTDDSRKTCKNAFAQIVKRGVCTFQDKAMNQLSGFGAEAVIVINSDVDELFVMSGGGFGVDDKFPVSVLITGDDGAKLLKLIQSYTEDGISQLTARISLRPDQAEIVESAGQEFSVVSNENWPAVRITPQVVQLFAKGGWGVHAVRNEKGSANAMEWQLFVLQHKRP